MIEGEVLPFLLNNSVAIGVLVWFMFRMEKVINNNTKAVNEVKTAVANCPNNKLIRTS